MPRSSTLTELIDATPWIDVHEHLVEERHRLRDEAYELGGSHRPLDAETG